MSEQYSSSRRQFIQGAGLIGGASLLSSPQVFSNGSSGRSTAKNLIFLVADGMGVGSLALANHWKLRHYGEPLEWVQLLKKNNVHRSLQDTASASSPVTDSAAAGSAWGSGERVNNGCINYSIQGNALVPLMQYAKQAGKSTGLVSTCRITHATPASFAANVLERDLEATIAEQYLQREVDLLMGGGLEYFITQGRNLCSEFKRSGYSFVTDQAGLSNLTDTRRILGLFADSHLPYAIDRKNDPSFALIPSLANMFNAALRPLSENENGFLLQVEAGRIDHAGHANDPAAILHEILEFDNCIPIALEFLKSTPNTLVIVTTDHGTGGCQLNGVGDSYNGSGSALDRINNFRGSFESIERIYQKTGKFSRAHFNSICDLDITKAQESVIVEKMLAGSDYMTSVIADAIATELYKETGVGWTSHDHTSELVELAAVGRGAEHFPNLLKNYEVNGIVRNILRI